MRLSSWGHLMTYSCAIVAFALCFVLIYHETDGHARPAAVMPFIINIYLIIAIQALVVMIVEVVWVEWVRWKQAGQYLARINQLGAENEAANHYVDLN